MCDYCCYYLLLVLLYFIWIICVLLLLMEQYSLVCFACTIILFTHTNTQLFDVHRVKRIFLCLQVSMEEIARGVTGGS